MEVMGAIVRLTLGIEHGLILRVQHRRQRAAGKREGAVEILRRDVVVGLAAQANAEAPGMRAFHDRSVVLQLVIVLRVESRPTFAPPSLNDCSTMDRRAGAVGDRLRGAAVVLEARFIHRAADQDGVGRLHCLVGELRMIAARSQVESADAVVPHVGVGNAVAEHQGVVLAELVVDARADVGVASGSDQHAGERLDAPASADSP